MSCQPATNIFAEFPMSDRRPLSQLPRLPLWLSLPAFGLGAGYSPRAPGTLGSLVAVALFAGLAALPLPLYVALLLVSTLAGIGICHAAAERLGVHDHGGIVWDEFVGQWIALLPLVPVASWDARTLLAVAAGFVLFRLFDIWKPWPVRVADRRVAGGLGIMLDDLIAGAMAAAVLTIGLSRLPH